MNRANSPFATQALTKSGFDNRPVQTGDESEHSRFNLDRIDLIFARNNYGNQLIKFKSLFCIEPTGLTNLTGENKIRFLCEIIRLCVSFSDKRDRERRCGGIRFQRL